MRERLKRSSYHIHPSRELPEGIAVDTEGDNPPQIIPLVAH